MFEGLQRTMGKGALWATKLELRESHDSLQEQIDALRLHVRDLQERGDERGRPGPGPASS